TQLSRAAAWGKATRGAGLCARRGTLDRQRSRPTRTARTLFRAPREACLQPGTVEVHTEEACGRRSWTSYQRRDHPVPSTDSVLSLVIAGPSAGPHGVTHPTSPAL